jgi:hypothetical protein
MSGDGGQDPALDDGFLDDKTLSLEQKIAKYLTMLKLLLLERRKTLKHAKHVEESVEAPVEPLEDGVAAQIIELAPQNRKKAARTLLAKLQEKPETVHWTEDGTLKYLGKPVPGTNIVDMVKASVTSSTKHMPSGMDSYIAALLDVNVPSALLLNPNVRVLMETARNKARPVLRAKRMRQPSTSRANKRRKDAAAWPAYETIK